MSSQFQMLHLAESVQKDGGGKLLIGRRIPVFGMGGIGNFTLIKLSTRRKNIACNVTAELTNFISMRMRLIPSVI